MTVLCTCKKPHIRILPVFVALICWLALLTISGCDSKQQAVQQNGQEEALGIEWQESSLCAIAYLGNVAMVANSHSIKEIFDSFADLYPIIKNDSSVKMIELPGDEIYFIVAKHADTRIMISEIDTTSVIMGGDVFTDLLFDDNFETALLLCNQSDLYSNCEIVISANGKRVAFSPRISLDYGSIMLPENGVQLLDIDLLKLP